MSDYWDLRDAQNMWEYMQSAEKTAELIGKSYRNSSDYIASEIDKIFTRFQTKNGLTKEEAYIVINQLQGKFTFDSLKRTINGTSLNKAKMKLAELEAPAYQARMKRLDELQKNIDRMARNSYGIEKNVSTNHYKHLAKESYFKEMFGIQQKTGKGFGVNLDEKAIDKVLNSKWSGANYSSRIWANTEALAKDVHETILEGLMTGESSHKMAKKIQEKYGSGEFEARRLIRTESAYVANEMKYQSMVDAGVKKYRFNATLDKRTSKICRELDGKTFDIKDKKVGKNYPPMHPFCRSVATAVFDDIDESQQERIARDPNTGKTNYVPRDMTYKEWESKYVDNVETKSYSNTETDMIDYFEEFNKLSTPNIGSVTFNVGLNLKTHQHEIDTADWLKTNFGGDIEVLNEINKPGMKTSDYLWNGLNWELKGIHSERNIEKNIKKAFSQIEKKPGGIIIDILEDDIDDEIAIKNIIKKVSEKKMNLTIIIKRGNKIVKILKK